MLLRGERFDPARDVVRVSIRDCETPHPEATLGGAEGVGDGQRGHRGARQRRGGGARRHEPRGGGAGRAGAIQSLPLVYREIVTLCELEELDYATAAAVVQCPIGTVRSRLHRAKALLASKLTSTVAVRSAPFQGAIAGLKGPRYRVGIEELNVDGSGERKLSRAVRHAPCDGRRGHGPRSLAGSSKRACAPRCARSRGRAAPEGRRCRPRGSGRAGDRHRRAVEARRPGSRGAAASPPGGAETAAVEVATAFFPLSYSGMPVSNAQIVGSRFHAPRWPRSG